MNPPNEIAVLVVRSKADDLARAFAQIGEMAGAGILETRSVSGLKVQVSVWPADQPNPRHEPAASAPYAGAQPVNPERSRRRPKLVGTPGDCSTSHCRHRNSRDGMFPST